MKAITDSLLAFITATNPQYVTSQVHEYLTSVIQQAVTRGNARLAISLPPRHGKSEIISKALPAWYFANNPTAQVMEVCYGSDLASDFGQSVRQLMNTPLYKHLYPLSVPVGDGKSGSKWRTVSDGIYKGTGVGGSITGFGANLMSIDDIVKNRATAHSNVFKRMVREFFGSTLFSRVLPNGSCIVLMTRWTADDLIGFVTQQLGWDYINLSAICETNDDPLNRNIGEALFPEFYPISRLLEIKASCTPYDWLSLYQGTPPDSTAKIMFTTTPPDYPPSKAVWFNDVLGLFHTPQQSDKQLGARHLCTHLIDVDSVNVLAQKLADLPYVDKLYTDHQIVHIKALHTLLPYKLQLESTHAIADFLPDIDTSLPSGINPTAQQIECIRQYQITQLGNTSNKSNRLEHSQLSLWYN